MPKTIAYIRVSTDTQDLEKQRHQILEYAHHQKMRISEFIQLEISSRKDQTKRRIDEVQSKLSKGDYLLTTELSRLGRNMVETLNIITTLTDKGVKVVFVRQPELSTSGAHGKLIIAIYSYFAEAERDFISLRTKHALAVLKAKGVSLGRPKGSKNKAGRRLDPVQSEIASYLAAGISMRDIHRLLLSKMEKPISYMAVKNYINDHSSLKAIRK